jgi:hypothetical protein
MNTKILTKPQANYQASVFKLEPEIYILPAKPKPLAKPKQTSLF